MDRLQFECRRCKKVTTQEIVRVTDLLPEGVETIQCLTCSCMTVALIGGYDENVIKSL